mgnify:CR=1 FL=1
MKFTLMRTRTVKANTPMKPKLLILTLTVLSGILATAAARADELLPDLSTSSWRLLSAQVDTTTIPGHELLRFSNSIRNRGRGPLELRGGTVVGDKQEVFQRIFKRDRSYTDQLVGTFIHHPTHQHVHFEGFAQYRLRKMTEQGDVGEIIVQADKTSYCVRNSIIFNPFKRGFRIKNAYKNCDSTVQGIGVGRADLYKSDVNGQWVDMTSVAAGNYWLESEVNPDHNIVESNYGNNIARVGICWTGISFTFGSCDDWRDEKAPLPNSTLQ